MKRFSVIFGLFYVLVSHSQITMQTNLPGVVNLNSEITFDVKINKGSFTNFSKYQLEIPQDIKIQEVDSRMGSFAAEEDRVKIIWVIAPNEPEFSVKLKLLSGTVAGQKSLVMKYFYMDADTKKEVEMKPYIVEVKEGASPSAGYETNFVSLEQKPTIPLSTGTISVTDINTKNPEVLKQQVMQLRNDSRDAKAVGEREKAKAEQSLNKANADVASAQQISDENAKKIALDKALNDRKRAEEDLDIANKVLVLAQSLADNANEIEAINKSVNPGSYAGGGSAAVATTTMPKTEAGATKPSFPSSAEPKVLGKTHLKPAEDAVEEGLVFKLQLGAFSKEPNKSEFKAIGKVAVKTENGMYKVLFGSFSSREEALQKRAELVAKGVDSFVVSYQDGVRVK